MGDDDCWVVGVMTRSDARRLAGAGARGGGGGLSVRRGCMEGGRHMGVRPTF